jgi:hypothetical protein
VWYLDHREEPGGAAVVRFLMNTRTEHQMLYTRMIHRDGEWWVDIAATLG